MIRIVLPNIQQSGARAASQSAAQEQVAADRAIENAIKAAERAAQSVGKVENAVQAAEQAAIAAEPPAPPAPGDPASSGNGPIVFSSEDGEPVSVSFKDGTLTLSQEGNTQAIALRDAIPREAVQIAWAIPATLSVLLIWWPISRAVIRWLNRKHVANTEAAALEARLRDRFETLERNLDTVAVEMERLSEGQRFTNKLLAERGEQVPVNVQR